MTPEQLLLTAITVVTGWLIFAVKLLWSKSEQCEKDRCLLRTEIESLKGDYGMARGRMMAFEMCPTDECPFKQRQPIRAIMEHQNPDTIK